MIKLEIKKQINVVKKLEKIIYELLNEQRLYEELFQEELFGIKLNNNPFKEEIKEIQKQLEHIKNIYNQELLYLDELDDIFYNGDGIIISQNIEMIKEKKETIKKYEKRKRDQELLKKLYIKLRPKHFLNKIYLSYNNYDNLSTSLYKTNHIKYKHSLQKLYNKRVRKMKDLPNGAYYKRALCMEWILY